MVILIIKLLVNTAWVVHNTAQSSMKLLVNSNQKVKDFLDLAKKILNH